MTKITLKMANFRRFFINFWTFWPLDRLKGLKINFCCFRYLSWEKLVQNDMSHAMLVPRINKFTAFENILLKFDRARLVFAVFRVCYAIFIYAKYRDMVFQIPLTILHLLICNKPMFWAIAWALGRPAYGWWRHYLWRATKKIATLLSEHLRKSSSPGAKLT